jgi:hypothetical protein
MVPGQFVKQLSPALGVAAMEVAGDTSKELGKKVAVGLAAGLAQAGNQLGGKAGCKGATALGNNISDRDDQIRDALDEINKIK